MPKETNLAARNDKGEVVLYHDSDYSSPALIELLEKYNSGSRPLFWKWCEKSRKTVSLSTIEIQRQRAPLLFSA